MNLFLKQIAISVFLICSLSANGQVKFSASLSSSVIGRDENTTLRILLINADDIQSLSPPSFKDIVLVSGPFQESGFQKINGISTSYLALNFIITGKRPGKFKITGATATISGRKYKSNAVELIVKNTQNVNANSAILPYSEPRPKPAFNDYIFKEGENVPEKVSKNMLLKLEVNKTSCYVGEPIIATYNLYTRLKSESRLSQNPSFNGFSVIDLQSPDITASSSGKLNGRDFNIYTIRKAQLYPLQDGKINLESAELENKVQFIRDSYVKDHPAGLPQLFDEFANASVPSEAEINQTVTLSSKPVTINVKPLPLEGKPASFKGAVGNLNFEAAIDKNNFSTNESGRLVLSIEGSGNLQLLTPPRINWPAGVETFDPKTSDNLNTATVPVSGTKDFIYTFSVDKPGEFVIPSIEFSYFDPESEAYKIINTKPVSFTVNKGSGIIKHAMPETSPTVKGATFYENVFGNRKWLVLILTGIILAGLAFYIRHEKKSHRLASIQPHTDPLKEADDLKMQKIVEDCSYNQQNPLQGAEKCLYDPECVTFYSLLNNEMKAFLSHKLFVPVEMINRKSLAEKMDKHNISNETVLKLQDLLQEIEWQLYTPFERNEKMEQMYHYAHSLLQMINTYETKPL